jgi:hypothetical protein
MQSGGIVRTMLPYNTDTGVRGPGHVQDGTLALLGPMATQRCWPTQAPALPQAPGGSFYLPVGLSFPDFSS